MATKAMSTMNVVTVGGTERILCQGADGGIIVASAFADYVIDQVVGATAVTAATGDAVVLDRSGAVKTSTLASVSSYVIDYNFSAASTATSGSSGDSFLMQRSGTVYDISIDSIKNYALVGIQADVLDVSALSSVTLASSDLVTICQGSTPGTVTLANLETQLWSDFKTYVEGLTAVTASVASDYYYCIQGGSAKLAQADEMAAYFDTAIIALGNVQTSTFSAWPAYVTALTDQTAPAANDELWLNRGGNAYKITMSSIATYAIEASDEIPWQHFAASKYTALPPSTSTLTMSDTTGMDVGDPIKFVQSGTTYYARITALSANTLITIAGAPFSTGVSITDLYVGTPQQVVTKTYVIESLVGDAVYDLMSTLGRYERWDGPPAYLVAYSATLGTADTGAAQPKFNIKVDTNLVSTDDSNKGLQVSSTPGTWTEHSNVQISTSYYDVNKGDAIEIRCMEAGTNLDAADLTLNLIFVYE